MDAFDKENDRPQASAPGFKLPHICMPEACNGVASMPESISALKPKGGHTNPRDGRGLQSALPTCIEGKPITTLKIQEAARCADKTIRARKPLGMGLKLKRTAQRVERCEAVEEWPEQAQRAASASSRQGDPPASLYESSKFAREKELSAEEVVSVPTVSIATSAQVVSSDTAGLTPIQSNTGAYTTDLNSTRSGNVPRLLQRLARERATCRSLSNEHQLAKLVPLYLEATKEVGRPADELSGSRVWIDYALLLAYVRPSDSRTLPHFR